MPKLRVLFLLRSLHRGGAEQQALLLAGELLARGHAARLATFYREGDLLAEAARRGIPCDHLGKGGRYDWLTPGRRLRRLVRSFAPQVVQAYLTEPNLAASLACLGLGCRVVWGIRAADLSLALDQPFLRLTFALAARLSPLAGGIVANSRAGAAWHQARGYAARRMVVIENGIDTKAFAPDPAGRERLRAAWGLGGAAPLVGLVGRLDPLKDIPGFLRAASLLAAELPAARFVVVGGGPVAYRQALERLAGGLGLADRVLFAGEAREMAPVYGALDLLVSASRTEGFSNVIAEALACGVPAVVTRVGDSPRIVGEAGEAGEVVPPGDPAALAAGIRRLWARLAAPGAELALVARRRIGRLFAKETMVERTLALYERLGAEGKPRCAPR